ncbi:uncharacterized protein LOC130934226 [Arachis stenosperma]|uniref:uncharacterized protein LOC130934226 n=1 Tax=Arachis stenosperma TaxID=217475 RepID=UPI0025AB9025|nr:uncharacterized protein LOC130934226 [Arachis stenosperma]
MANPRGECKAITLKSGKIVEETSPSQSDQEEEVAKEPEIKKEEKTSTPSSPKQVLKSYVPQAPYPQRLRKDGKDSQFSSFLEIFKKLQINIPFVEALCDLGASINLMSLAMMRRMRIEEAKPARMTLQLADRTFKFPHGMVEDLLVKVEEFIFPADFVVLDMEEEANTLIILGRPFLATAGAIIDIQKGKLVLRLHEENMVFNVFKAMS